MKEITRINHIGIRVANLEVSREFYEKIGFAFIVGPVGPEPVAIMEHPSGININFILVKEPHLMFKIISDLYMRIKRQISSFFINNNIIYLLIYVNLILYTIQLSHDMI